MMVNFRIEHCPICHKLMINHGQNLAYDKYLKNKDCTWCRKCAEIFNNGRRGVMGWCDACHKEGHVNIYRGFNFCDDCSDEADALLLGLIRKKGRVE